MDIKDFLANAKNLTSDQLSEKLNKLVRENYHYSNLDEGNKKLILGIIQKYKSRIRDGQGISSEQIRKEGYQLYENRLKLKLTEKDLDDIKNVLSYFKK